MKPLSCQITLATPAAPGAVGIVQVVGPDARAMLAAITGREHWRIGNVHLVEFEQFDQGMAVLLRDDVAQLMPHAGPRVIQKLLQRLIELGASYEPVPDVRAMYCEAAGELEAHALATLAQAASPAAIDLLLAQCALWKRWLDTPASQRESAATILARSDVLDRLVHPPSVVVMGRPNVGKSTLSNHMLGRDASVVTDLPGTTRDWVAGMAELTTPARIVVRWLDTPGVRDSNDPIEREAIELSKQVIDTADVLMAMRDPAIDWPDLHSSPRPVDLWIINKADLLPSRSRLGAAQHSADIPTNTPDLPLAISAATGWNINHLQQHIARKLQLHDLHQPTLWAFCPPLREALRSQESDRAIRALL